MSNNIQSITVTIQTGNGEEFRLIATKPGPQGGNPRFMGQQVDAAFADLLSRATALIESQWPSQLPESPAHRLGRQMGEQLRKAGVAL